MVLTRHQARRLSNPDNDLKQPNTDSEAQWVKDPPILSISRSCLQDDEPAIRVGNLLEQLDDFEVSVLDALMARWPSMHARLKGMKPHLPPKKDDHRPTLVLDLDETLLHTYRQPDDDTEQELLMEADYVVYAKDGQSCLAGILRPGVTEFLTWASSIFEVVVWTAGHDEYAQMVRGLLDPKGVLITHMLTRRTCIRMRSAATGDVMYIKDLCALGRDLSRTFFVDNTPHAATLNLSNFIPIESFVGGTTDTELHELQRFLSNLVRLDDRKNDMRILLHRKLNLKRRLRERIDDWKKGTHHPPH